MTMTINDLIEKKIPLEMIDKKWISESGYGIKYFAFWGVVPREDVLYWNEIRPKLLAILEELKKVKTVEEVGEFEREKLDGQLWEECGCCSGDGPVYISHGCCAKCAGF